MDYLIVGVSSLTCISRQIKVGNINLTETGVKVFDVASNISTKLKCPADTSINIKLRRQSDHRLQ